MSPPAGSNELNSPTESAIVLPTRDGWFKPACALLGVLLVGLVARAALSTVVGYGGDFRWFRDWTQTVARDGFAVLYGLPDMNYPPLHVLTMRFFGELWRMFDPAFARTLEFGAYLRLPAVVADLVITMLLFAEGRRLYSARGGVLIAALYFLNPAAWYATAYWCQVDSIHSGLLLAALVSVNRRKSFACGAFTALALLQKLQSIFCVPLLIFEVYRYQRWRGFGWWLGGAAVAAAAVCAPLALDGVLSTAFEKGYRNVVGQYPENSTNAFNFWYAIGSPDAPDHTTPPVLTALVAPAGAATVDVREHWVLSDPRFALTFRKLSIVAFGLCVALLLTALAATRRHDQRAFIAGALVLSAFTLLTEMHERYAYPLLALWPLWVGVWPGRQLAYWLFSALFAINVIGVLNPEQIQRHIGWGFAALLLWALFVAWRGGRSATPIAVATERLADPPPGPSRIIRVFVGASIAAWLAAAGAVAWTARELSTPRSIDAPGVAYLSDLTPTSVRNGWKEMRLNESISGAPLRIGHTIYRRGLGTHAPARVEYAIPPGVSRFATTVYVPLIKDSKARLRCRVLLDDRPAWTGKLLVAGDVVPLDLELGGATRLTLEADALGPTSGDHVDWCDAKFVAVPAASAAPAASAESQPAMSRPSPAPPTDAEPGNSQSSTSQPASASSD